MNAYRRATQCTQADLVVALGFSLGQRSGAA
jgi:hypothetical protein